MTAKTIFHIVYFFLNSSSVNGNVLMYAKTKAVTVFSLAFSKRKKERKRYSLATWYLLCED